MSADLPEPGGAKIRAPGLFVVLNSKTSNDVSMLPFFSNIPPFAHRYLGNIIMDANCSLETIKGNLPCIATLGIIAI